MAVSRFNPDYPDAGLVQIAPSSVTVGSGSGSANGNGSINFSGASSISINDCFSATYSNYRLIFDITGSTGLSNFLRFRVSGSDNSSNQYDFASYGSSSTASTYQESISGNSAFSLLGRMESTSTKQVNVCLDVIKPFASDFYTIIQGYCTFAKASNNFLQITYAGQMRVQTSYTGFTYAPDSGTITGTVSVYGYRS